MIGFLTLVICFLIGIPIFAAIEKKNATESVRFFLYMVLLLVALYLLLD